MNELVMSYTIQLIDGVTLNVQGLIWVGCR
jgi:hypothetical protein